MVGGRLDGITTDPETGEDVLIEIKNRQKNIFRSLPMYERVQVIKAVLNQLNESRNIFLDFCYFTNRSFVKS